MDGVIVINKPQDFTSFDVVAVMRGLIKEKKAGHTGTLDPMATGVLPLLFGNATKAQSLLPDSDKEYKAEFKLGVTTDTLDITGKVISENEVNVKKSDILNILADFTGEIMQLPPMYSAVQKDGKRLYDLARKGMVVERKPRPVFINGLKLLDYDEKSGTGSLRVSCSKGTYIRTLIDDIGRALGCGGTLTALCRTAACGYSLSDAITVEQAKKLAEENKLAEKVRPVEDLFALYNAVAVTQPQANRFSNGGALDINRTAVKKESSNGNIYRVKSPNGEFLGLGIVKADKQELAVLKLFNIKR